MIFFGKAIINDELDLAMFWYKNEDKNIARNEDLNNDFTRKVPKGVF